MFVIMYLTIVDSYRLYRVVPYRAKIFMFVLCSNCSFQLVILLCSDFTKRLFLRSFVS